MQVGTAKFHDIWSLKLICRENFNEIPLRISTALDKRKQAQKAYWHRRDHFGLSAGPPPKAKGRKLVDIPTVEVKKLKEEYPPSGHDIYETVTAWEIWEEYREMTPVRATLHPDAPAALELSIARTKVLDYL